MSGTVLQAAGVSKTFEGVRALDHVSFAIGPGEVHALVGSNGAGKSTLVKVLSGVYQPDAGELRMHGEPIEFAAPAQARRAGIATIHQENTLLPPMSVARNLFLGKEPRSRFGLIDFARMHAEADQVIQSYGMRLDVRRPLDSLPPGTRQLVAMAKAAWADARVIIMDEPTVGLDPGESETLFRAIARLRDHGRSVIYVSPRLEELYRICDTVTVLREGRVVHTGALSEIDRVGLVSLMLGRPLRQAPPGTGPADAPAASPVVDLGSKPVTMSAPVVLDTPSSGLHTPKQTMIPTCWSAG
ncbi:ATP-binding cassette domain-containing protein [Spongiactinospora sp. TRM90649]|uniref:ATP-binding cassette domain-containing protein n=1 Tax=Spongiactinospora sp. TRM90649 TaxID=3031114 RepID=UPI0023F64BE0|nr:ATP-binding cassette domain-containing protein [Spongiactinospora sp. TRM90649]MDF5757216.1 ATP-binding cassette domain-containing protein [Spongiactinospora sp. TRM90649]